MPLWATLSHNFRLVARSKWHSTLLESSPLNSKWKTGHKFSLEEVLESLNSGNLKSSTADNSRQILFWWLHFCSKCIKTLPAKVLVNMQSMTVVTKPWNLYVARRMERASMNQPNKKIFYGWTEEITPHIQNKDGTHTGELIFYQKYLSIFPSKKPKCRMGARRLRSLFLSPWSFSYRCSHGSGCLLDIHSFLICMTVTLKKSLLHPPYRSFDARDAMKDVWGKIFSREGSEDAGSNAFLRHY